MLELSHKKLIAWQRAISMMPLLYKVCEKMPREEIYNLVAQMKRAGLSVSNNIAEGAARKSKAEKARFYEVARSSLVEIDNCLVNCLELNFLTPTDLKELNPVLLEEFKLLTGLIDANNQ
ncbi:MAG TPA: four helix bundle protein [Flavisolibacter sp.]|jgi:four helix bundle protein|nr:four helix bundle protein [Flavisolibacter sp.]